MIVLANSSQSLFRNVATRVKNQTGAGNSMANFVITTTI